MRLAISIIILSSLLSCSPKISIHTPDDLKLYEDDHIRWQNWRIKTLTAPEGWLSVIGLYWLKEGDNTIGSTETDDIQLGEFGRIQSAKIILSQGELYFEAGGESYITSNGKRFIKGSIEIGCEWDTNQTRI